MNADRDAFLRAIIAQPDDDLPRLIFADWLNEHHEPVRAEFIRVQCRLAAHERAKGRISKDNQYPEGLLWYSKWHALRRRQRELLAAAGDSWKVFVRVAERHTRAYAGQVFRRGFVAEIALPWPDWQTHAAALLAACPIRNAADGLVRLHPPPDDDDCIRHGAAVRAYRDGRPLVWTFTTWPSVRFQLPAAAAYVYTLDRR